MLFGTNTVPWANLSQRPNFKLGCWLRLAQGTVYDVLDWVEISTGKGNFGGCPAHWKALGVSAAVYAAKGIIQSLITARLHYRCHNALFPAVMRPFLLWLLVIHRDCNNEPSTLAWFTVHWMCVCWICWLSVYVIPLLQNCGCILLFCNSSFVNTIINLLSVADPGFANGGQG